MITFSSYQLSLRNANFFLHIIILMALRSKHIAAGSRYLPSSAKERWHYVVCLYLFIFFTISRSFFYNALSSLIFEVFLFYVICNCNIFMIVDYYCIMVFWFNEWRSRYVAVLRIRISLCYEAQHHFFSFGVTFLNSILFTLLHLL